MDRYLFRKEDSSKHFKFIKETAAIQINNQLNADYLKNTDEFKIVESVYESWKAKSLVLLKDRIDQPTVNHDERTIEIKIPYTGNPSLFNIRPSSLSKANPIEGKPDQHLVDRNLEQFVTISVRESDDVGNVLDNLDKHIEDITKQCDDFNIELKKFIEANVKKRCQEILNLENKAKEADIFLREKLKKT